MLFAEIYTIICVIDYYNAVLLKWWQMSFEQLGNIFDLIFDSKHRVDLNSTFNLVF